MKLSFECAECRSNLSLLFFFPNNADTSSIDKSYKYHQWISHSVISWPLLTQLVLVNVINFTPVWKHSKQWLQQLYVNEPKFNSKNRIFLSCVAGNLRTISGKCVIKTPPFCSCLPLERRNILWRLSVALNTSLCFLPKADLVFPVKANQRKQEAILFGIGLPRTERQEEEARGTSWALSRPLRPGYVFLASRLEFTGSPRKESQVGRWVWVKNWKVKHPGLSV